MKKIRVIGGLSNIVFLFPFFFFYEIEVVVWALRGKAGEFVGPTERLEGDSLVQSAQRRWEVYSGFIARSTYARRVYLLVSCRSLDD